jgi:hypothetical protein
VVATSFLQSQFFGLNLGIMGELKTLNSGSALLANISDDVGNGIGLVLQVAIGDIHNAHLAVSFAVTKTVVQTLLHFWGHVIAIGAVPVGTG